MATVELTADNFEAVVGADGIVIVDWWASWCGPCRTFAPVFEEASGDHPDITFAKIDTEAEQDLSAAAGIRSIPTIMAFRDGILVFGQPGALPRAVLDDLVDQVRGLDMDEVRADVARRHGPDDGTAPEPTDGERTDDIDDTDDTDDTDDIDEDDDTDESGPRAAEG